MTGRCPHCHGPLVASMPARIFAAIERAGIDGISGADLADMIYGDRTVSRALIAVHVNQINKRLRRSNCYIVGRGGYRVVRPYHE